MQKPTEPLSTILYRVEAVERDLVQLKNQLNMYEPVRENDLKLSRINDIVARIEAELRNVRDKIETINTRMVEQEKEAQERDTAQRESQARLQIRTLWYVVSAVFTILSAVLIAYLTHLIH